MQDKALGIIKEIMNSELVDGNRCSFPEIVYGLDISEFQKQKSDLDGVDFEYVDQHGGDDYEPTHGRMAYRLFEDNFLVVEYWEI